jgi:hypothetical protein
MNPELQLAWWPAGCQKQERREGGKLFAFFTDPGGERQLGAVSSVVSPSGAGRFRAKM